MPVPTREQLADETRRVRKVRQIVDISTSLLMQSNMTRREADALVQRVRAWILSLFPDGEQTYEIIYAQRFRRLIDEFARPDEETTPSVDPPLSTSRWLM